MFKLPLPKGRFALVDDADKALVMQYRWRCFKIGGTFYARTDKGVYLHRLLMKPRGLLVVDHINHNGLDNRRANLRVCTRAQNLMNRGPQSNNTSGAKGVSWYARGRKWEAYIKLRGKKHVIGRFKSKADAIQARDKAAPRFHGEFAYMNH